MAWRPVTVLRGRAWMRDSLMWSDHRARLGYRVWLCISGETAYHDGISALACFGDIGGWS